METMMTIPTPQPARLRMPAGTFARRAVLCTDPALRLVGTGVFGAGVSTIAARTHAYDVLGVRSWSPPD